MAFATIDELEAALRGASYLPERGLSTALFLSLALEKPLLLEGEAGVGKTEAGKALATATSARLIRLQCYEGLDVAHAVYEWNYSRQLLHIRAVQEGTVSEQELFGPHFLIRRPLLAAIESDDPVVLLIDEIDRADDEFEVGPARIADALAGLDRVGIGAQDDVYWALRTTLVSRAEDIESFDRAFAAWFLRAPSPLTHRAGEPSPLRSRTLQRRTRAPPAPPPPRRGPPAAR